MRLVYRSAFHVVGNTDGVIGREVAVGDEVWKLYNEHPQTIFVVTLIEAPRPSGGERRVYLKSKLGGADWLSNAERSGFPVLIGAEWLEGN
jgi:hypothetical protein